MAENGMQQQALPAVTPHLPSRRLCQNGPEFVLVCTPIKLPAPDANGALTCLASKGKSVRKQKASQCAEQRPWGTHFAENLLLLRSTFLFNTSSTTSLWSVKTTEQYCRQKQ
jgi:hypothetical protein